MPEYRAYIVGEDGHFIGYEPMVCANDNEATEKAKRLSNGGRVELWSGPYLVALIAAGEISDYAIPHEMHDGRMVPKPAHEVSPPQLAAAQGILSLPNRASAKASADGNSKVA